MLINLAARRAQVVVARKASPSRLAMLAPSAADGPGEPRRRPADDDPADEQSPAWQDFGRVGDTLRTAVDSHVEFVAAWRRHGAITIDATQDLDTVVEELLKAAAMAAPSVPRPSN